MLPRLPVVLGLALLLTLPAFCGCSSSNRRDQFYGTDQGANYQIPDAAVFTGQTGDADVTEDVADAGSADAVDARSADPADAGSEDAAADTGGEESDSGFDS